MQHGHKDEQALPNRGPVPGSIEEQLEMIQDDVNLLKIEIKQTLVDLREFILNSKAGFLPRSPEDNRPPAPTPVASSGPVLVVQAAESGSLRSKVPEVEAADSRVRQSGSAAVDGPTARDPEGGWRSQNSSNGNRGASRENHREDYREDHPGDYREDYREDYRQDHREDNREDDREDYWEDYRDNYREDYRIYGKPSGGNRSTRGSSRRQPEPTYMRKLDEARKIGEIDVEMLVKLLAWLDSIKGTGISPEQVRPFLQAYEAQGTLTATMSTIIFHSIREISKMSDVRADSTLSSEEYLGYLQQLHRIVYGAQPERSTSYSEPPTGVRRIKAGPEGQG